MPFGSAALNHCPLTVANRTYTARLENTAAQPKTALTRTCRCNPDIQWRLCALVGGARRDQAFLH
jgi:hypothetical protein